MAESATPNPNMPNPEEGSGGGSGERTYSQAEYDALEKRRRDFQAERDRLDAQLREATGSMADVGALEARLAEMEGKLAKVPTADDIAGRVLGGLSQRQALDTYRASMQSRYPGVDLTGLSGRTPEELEAAAKGEAAKVAAVREQVEKDLRAQYAKKYGKLDGNDDAMDQGHGGRADGGALTVERFIDMTPQEAARLSDEDFDRMSNLAAAKHPELQRALKGE